MRDLFPDAAPSQHMSTVLVVDDDPMATLLTSKILEPYVPTILVANDAREALRLAMTKTPDLILLDHQMPEVDGVDVLRQLKIMERTQHIPVIMLTGDDRLETVQAAIQSGAADYVLKSCDDAFLLERVRKWLPAIQQE